MNENEQKQILTPETQFINVKKFTSYNNIYNAHEIIKI